MASLVKKTAFVIGYTGETGKCLVKELAKSDQFERVVLIGRRLVNYEDPDMAALEQKVLNYDKLDESKDVFSGFDVGFCCLGTTKNKAGSAEAFKKVDFDYVHKVAMLCKDGGTKHFHYQSSAGADKSSSFLYPRTKGQIEETLSQLMFERLSIYRPKILLCDREESRPGERFFMTLLKPIIYLKPTAVSTPTEIMAKAMVENTFKTTEKPVEIIFNNEIFQLAGKLKS